MPGDVLIGRVPHNQPVLELAEGILALREAVTAAESCGDLSRKCSAACPGFGISCRGLLHQSWLADSECREVRQPHPTNLPAGGTGIQEYRACPCWALTAQRPEQGHQERGYSLLLLSQQCRSFQILHPSCWFLVYQQSQSTHVLLFYGSSLWPLFIVMLP